MEGGSDLNGGWYRTSNIANGLCPVAGPVVVLVLERNTLATRTSTTITRGSYRYHVQVRRRATNFKG
eukprot:scaffold532508_cov22-Prasinocladus_malaysianus.AAC.1